MYGFGINPWPFNSSFHRDSNEARLKAIIEKFLLGEGRYQPSWRAMIYLLDEVEEVQLADKIRSFGEPIQGGCRYLFMCVKLKNVEWNNEQNF